MERELGGGIGMGNTCKPLAVSFQCMTKSYLSFKKSVLKCRNRKEVTDHSTNGPQNTPRQEMHPASLSQGE